MNNAFCTADNLIYSALEFARLPADRLERLRRLLRCPECYGPGYFHNSSYDGRILPFFGAWPHASGCSLAVARECETSGYSTPDIMDKTLCMPSGKIIVEFDFYGSSALQEFDEYAEPEPALGHAGRIRGNGCRPDALIHRCLNSLLRVLTRYPEFKNSVKPIEIQNGIVTNVRDFFVPLLEVNSQHLGLFRGFYGMLSDVRLSEDNKCVWFNSGGLDTISFRLDSMCLDEFNRRYRFHDKEDLSGASILVFGTLQNSQNKKFYCEIENLAFMALKFM